MSKYEPPNKWQKIPSYNEKPVSIDSSVWNRWKMNTESIEKMRERQKTFNERLNVQERKIQELIGKLDELPCMNCKKKPTLTIVGDNNMPDEMVDALRVAIETIDKKRRIKQHGTTRE